jgi:hypothetical protein
MKRYLIFGGDHFYAMGGFHDFLSSHDVISDAMRCVKQYPEGYVQWWHIFDSESHEIVAYSGTAYMAGDESPCLQEILPDFWTERGG